MKVKLRTIAAGPTLNVQPGQIIDVDAVFAGLLIAGGFATAVDPPARRARPIEPIEPIAEMPLPESIPMISIPGRKRKSKT